MKNNENIKEIIDMISDMVLEYINEQQLRKSSNKNTS